MSRLRFARMTDEREDPAVFGLIRFRTLSALSTQLGEFTLVCCCLFMEGAVDGCRDERVARSGNRQRWHSHVRRFEDSAYLKRTEA